MVEDTEGQVLTNGSHITESSFYEKRKIRTWYSDACTESDRADMTRQVQTFDIFQ